MMVAKISIPNYYFNKTFVQDNDGVGRLLKYHLLLYNFINSLDYHLRPNHLFKINKEYHKVDDRW